MHIHYLVWKHAVNILIKIIPSLSYNLHKGQLGRIGVIGGSRDYCGAPYYCGESTLKFGADLCTIYCSYDALIPIKSYSPELMVTPFYKLQGNSNNNSNNNNNSNVSSNSNNNNSNNNSNVSSNEEEEEEEFIQTSMEYSNILNTIAMKRLHSIIIGPGLGRHPQVGVYIKDVIRAAIAQDIR